MVEDRAAKIDAVYNIINKRKMALMAIDFSFYHNLMEIVDYEVPFFFNKLFGIIKQSVLNFGGTIESIFGDSCIITFGKYCGVNVELVACECGKMIMDQFIESFKDTYPDKEVYISIAIHCDDVYRTNYHDENLSMNFISGQAMHILQKILNITPHNKIYYSENVRKNVNFYIPPVCTSCIYSLDNSKQSVYELGEITNPESTDMSFDYPDLKNKFSGLINFFNKKLQTCKAMIYEAKPTNLRNCFFDMFFEENDGEYIPFNSTVKENQFEPLQNVLYDFYQAFQNLMFEQPYCHNKQLLGYSRYLRECFGFDPVDYQTSVIWDSLLYALLMMFRALSKIKKVVITVENIDFLDNSSIRFFSTLIQALNSSDVYFVFTSSKQIEEFDSRYCSYIPLNEYNLRDTTQYAENMYCSNLPHLSDDFNQYVYNLTDGNLAYIEELLFYLADKDLIDCDNKSYMNVKPDLNALIEYKLSLMNEAQQQIAGILSYLPTNVSLDLLKDSLPETDVIEQLQNMSDKKIIFMKRINHKNYVRLYRQSYAAVLQSKHDAQTRKECHRKIADGLQIAYAHSIQKFYSLLAHHYEQADMIDETIYYTFASALSCREQDDKARCRELLKHAMLLAEKTPAFDRFHTFTDEEFEFFDYQDYKKYFKYKCKLPVSLDLIYYFYAKTYSLHESEALEYLQKSYQYAKKYNRDFTILLSSLHYFIYKCYNDRIVCLEYLKEAAEIAKNHNDDFMIGFIDMSYMDIIFSDCKTDVIREDQILDIFFEAKINFDSSLSIVESLRKALNIYYHSTYAFYLKRTNADLKKILKNIRSAENYFLSERDEIEFYDCVASGFGPLVGTPYQMDYTKKELNIALKYCNLWQVIQLKSGVGYQYMLVGRYEKSLKYYLSAKDLSEATFNLRENHMAYKNLGDLYNCLKAYDEAKNCYQKCLEIPIVFDGSHKLYVDFADPIFAKSALAFSLIKTDQLDEARALIKDVQSSMTNIFFGSEIPIFLTFLKAYLSLIVQKYDNETVKIMKNCYIDMKRISPNAIQLVWIKRELMENGIEV